MKNILDGFVKDYLSRFSAPFVKNLEEKAQGHIKEAELRVPDAHKRALLTKLYSKRTSSKSLGGWKRFLCLNGDKDIAQIKKELG